MRPEQITPWLVQAIRGLLTGYFFLLFFFMAVTLQPERAQTWGLLFIPTFPRFYLSYIVVSFLVVAFYFDQWLLDRTSARPLPGVGSVVMLLLCGHLFGGVTLLPFVFGENSSRVAMIAVEHRTYVLFEIQYGSGGTYYDLLTCDHSELACTYVATLDDNGLSYNYPSLHFDSTMRQIIVANDNIPVGRYTLPVR